MNSNTLFEIISNNFSAINLFTADLHFRLIFLGKSIHFLHLSSISYLLYLSIFNFYPLSLPLSIILSINLFPTKLLHLVKIFNFIYLNLISLSFLLLSNFFFFNIQFINPIFFIHLFINIYILIASLYFKQILLILLPVLPHNFHFLLFLFNVHLISINDFSSIHSFSSCPNSYNTTDCPICHVPFLSSDSIRLLKCKHLYHKNCIDEWLGRNRRCPTCFIQF
jgi:hypothetical protein